MEPKQIASAAQDLRDATIGLLEQLDSEQLSVEALPPRNGGTAWTVADVFRHLAQSDRDVVLGGHLLDFLPFQDEDEFEAENDRALERLRTAPRSQLRDELDAWGRRLRFIIRNTPKPLARLTVPTMFGSVSLGWFAGLRVYDEWVHQDDIHRALGLEPPEMQPRTRNLLAEFLLRALPAKPLRNLERRDDVVQVAFTDALAQPAWRFDLSTRTFGPRVDAEPTATIETDVPTWTRIAANRLDWREAERSGALDVAGEGRDAAAALLDIVRVV